MRRSELLYPQKGQSAERCGGSCQKQCGHTVRNPMSWNGFPGSAAEMPCWADFCWEFQQVVLPLCIWILFFLTTDYE